MKAAVMYEVGKPLKIENVPEPVIGPNEVLIETRACGLCGTDLHIIKGWGYVPKLPHILGHEPAGIVKAVGKDVKNIKVEDRVVPHLFIACGTCYYCRVGKHQMCSDLKGIIGEEQDLFQGNSVIIAQRELEIVGSRNGTRVKRNIRLKPKVLLKVCKKSDGCILTMKFL